MSKIANAHTIRLVENTGATILLKLATNAVANFSVDGRVWYPLIAAGISGSSGSADSYVFTGGILEHDGIVTLDTSVVATLDSRGKVDSDLLPPIPSTTQNGLAISDSGTIYVSEPNVAGNIVIVNRSGKVPDSVLPKYPKTFSNGLSLSVDGVLAVTECNTPGNIVVVPEGGKLPTNLLPEQELPDIATDYSNGLVLVDGTLGIDGSLANTAGNVALVTDSGKLPDSILPAYPKSFDNGLELDDSGKLHVAEPNTAGNLVVLNAEGKLPDGLVPIPEVVKYEGGQGIKIEDNIISEDWKDYR